MKQIKLDENFPPGFTSVFEAGGIDASSVLKQNISGTDDDHLYQLCIKEKRIIVTFDLDFANIIRYPSATTSGATVMVVLVRAVSSKTVLIGCMGCKVPDCEDARAFK